MVRTHVSGPAVRPPAARRAERALSITVGPRPWVPQRYSFERVPTSTPLEAKPALAALIRGSKKAVDEVFDPWFDAPLTEGRDADAFEHVLRQMHATIASSGYAGFMAGKAETQAAVPGQMFKDTHPADYSHPYLVQVDPALTGFHQQLRDQVKLGTIWHIDFEGLPRDVAPINQRFRDADGDFVQHDYALVGTHDWFLARTAGLMNRIRALTKSIEAEGQALEKTDPRSEELAVLLGELYRSGMAPQFFPRINNSIFMASVNRVLSRVGQPQISPGVLDDHAAMSSRAGFHQAFRRALDQER